MRWIKERILDKTNAIHGNDDHKYDTLTASHHKSAHGTFSYLICNDFVF